MQKSFATKSISVLLSLLMVLLFGVTAYAAPPSFGSYTVTYHANNGTDETVSDTVDGIGTLYWLRSCDFTAPESMGFTGWNTAADGSGTQYGTVIGTSVYGTIGVNSNMDLYAQWRPYARWSEAPAANEGLTENGVPQALITAGAVTNGTPYYYVTQEEISVDTADNLFWPDTGKPGSFSTEIPTGTDVGTYYVWYAIDGGDDTSEGIIAFDSMPKSLTVTIDHDWEWVTDADADCGNPGEKHQKCQYCGATQAEGTVIPATAEHEWEWVTDVAATCKDTGLAHQACKNCDAVQNENTVLDVTDDHVYGEDDWTPATFATCGDDGVLPHFTCTVCGKNFDAEGNELDSVVDPATGEHEWEWVTDEAPSCTANGVQHQHCTVCDQDQALNTPIPAAHEFDAWVAPVDPDCGNDGNVGYYHCHVCGDDFDAEGNKLDTVILPATGAHDYTGAAWGYADENHHARTCTICGQTENENHAWTWEIDTPADCGNDGIEHQKCAVCGAVKDEGTVISATGQHTAGEPEINTKPATCGEDGYTITTTKCAVCGVVLESTTLVMPATGEHQTELKGEKAATATKDGYTGDEVCTVCGKTIKTGEDTPDAPTEPTEPAEPADEGACPICGEAHNGGVFDRLIGFIHSLIALFRNLFSGASSIC